MKATKTASLEELRAMYARGETRAPGNNGPENDMPEGFWDTAEPQMPKTKKPVSLRVDPDILDWFKAQGDGHLTRMHAVLRAYVDARKNIENRSQHPPKAEKIASSMPERYDPCPRGDGNISKKTRHVDRVMSAVHSRSAAAHSPLAASWSRSAERHGLDPAASTPGGRLDAAGLRERCERLERFMRVAEPRLDRLFGLVGNAGCAVLLTDEDGIVLDQRCPKADEGVFQDWGLWPGADWSEAAEGTNGIGTCLAERRQVTIHRDDHFLARNIGMSCMDAPIFGPDGRLLAALDVSSARADQTEGYNRLTTAMVEETARAIEADFFRASWPRARIIVAGEGGAGGGALLAVDADDIVIGATRDARKAFGLEPDGTLKPRPASDLFGRGDGPSGFEKGERAAVMRALARANGNVSEAARALGVGRATLYRRMKRLGLDG